MRMTALVAAALAGALAITLVPGGARSGQLGPRAPDFSAAIWFNSKPLTLEQLRGKVVLVDFWEYTCINCVRTFPHLRRWNRLYGPLGLVIIGVHTPEFDFARNPELVRNAVKRFRLSFPIAVDSDRKIWDAFHNNAWPADYLIDSHGRLVERHIGEGGYAALEREIQRLLKQAHPALNFSAAKYRIPNDKPEFGGVCMRSTPETYLGSLRADRLANGGGVTAASSNYTAPRNVPLDEFALDGPWSVGDESIRRPASAKKGPSSLILHYGSKSVYLVAGSNHGASGVLYVSQDGKALPKRARGVDVQADASGRTYIVLGRKRMYYVVNNPSFSEHVLKLSTTSPALALYSFTFGNNCEPSFAHD
jgi:thiol-disulfide isomerase/thioredoxin